MNEDTEEFLGVGKHDYWYYPGLVLAIASFWVSAAPIVLLLLAASTGFVVVFLGKSTPRYMSSRDLKQTTRGFGLSGNLLLLLLQIGIVAVRVARLVA